MIGTIFMVAFAAAFALLVGSWSLLQVLQTVSQGRWKPAGVAALVLCVSVACGWFAWSRGSAVWL